MGFDHFPKSKRPWSLGLTPSHFRPNPTTKAQSVCFELCADLGRKLIPVHLTTNWHEASASRHQATASKMHGKQPCGRLSSPDRVVQALPWSGRTVGAFISSRILGSFRPPPQHTFQQLLTYTNGTRWPYAVKSTYCAPNLENFHQRDISPTSQCQFDGRNK